MLEGAAGGGIDDAQEAVQGATQVGGVEAEVEHVHVGRAHL